MDSRQPRFLIAICMLCLISFTIAPLVNAQSANDSNLLVEISDLSPQEIIAQGFVLTSTETLMISAIGAEPRYDDNKWFSSNSEDRDVWPANAWILDANTRELVWDLQAQETERERSGLHSFEGSVTLPAGVYEALYGSYVATGSSWYSGNAVRSAIRDLLGKNDDRHYSGPYIDNGDYTKFNLKISGNGRTATNQELNNALDAFTATSVFTFQPRRDDGFEYAFELSRDMVLDIYALGEMDDNGGYDYAWIIDASTHELVWEMDYRSTDHAGGAHKNRQVREQLRLDAGQYVAYVVSDDSHGPNDWNMMPPNDPDFWGLTLRAENVDMLSNVTEFDYEFIPEKQTVLSLTRIRDDEMVSDGFSIDRPMDVRIFALGEGTGNEMHDYGWIVDANTRQRIWRMDYRDTEHAGGAKKNRLLEEEIRLDAGDYIVYYRSDGSHSYSDWNASAPANSDYWGITLYTSSEGDAAQFSALRPSSARPVLAELIRVGDSEHERARFELNERTEINIFALGEGSSGEMYDTAWIEESGTGRVVWEMTYRTTEHGGGASKNRMYAGSTVLSAGDYILHYESDGSHSYEDWNSSPPDDPESWGVTLTRTSGD